MNTIRRNLLKSAAAAGFVRVAAAAGLLNSVTVQAAAWDKTAFSAEDIDAAVRSMWGIEAVVNDNISIKVPTLAENGAMVPVEIISNIPDTDSIAIIVEKNAIPLVAKFDFKNGGDGFVATRVKMAESSKVQAVVRAGGKIFKAGKEVKVTLSGCDAPLQQLPATPAN